MDCQRKLTRNILNAHSIAHFYIFFVNYTANALCCRDCGVFVAIFAEYLLDGLEISNHLEDIDVIRIQYGVLLWD